MSLLKEYKHPMHKINTETFYQKNIKILKPKTWELEADKFIMK